MFNKTIIHTGGTAAQNIQLDKNLAKGVYQIQLMDVNGKSITQKIIKN